MSASIDDLYQKLLESGFSEEELEKQVQSKEKEFGGFMSKQGILFIIAKENGIYLQSPDINEQFYKEFEEEIDYNDFTIDILEVKESMTNIVLLGKILKVFQPREFNRKDGSMGAVCSFLLADSTKTVKIVLWDAHAKAAKNEYFRVNELVRLIGGYSKAGKTGDLEVHLGRRGKLVLSPKDLSQRARDKLDSVNIDQNHEKNYKTVPKESLKECILQNKFVSSVKGHVRIENFKELELKSGEKSFLLVLLLDIESFGIRVKVWGMDAIECLKYVSDGDCVSITNLTVKENFYTSEKELIFTKNSTLKIL
jgi:ssDNA-binding replication factor A large subunit